MAGGQVVSLQSAFELRLATRKSDQIRLERLSVASRRTSNPVAGATADRATSTVSPKKECAHRPLPGACRLQVSRRCPEQLVAQRKPISIRLVHDSAWQVDSAAVEPL